MVKDHLIQLDFHIPYNVSDLRPRVSVWLLLSLKLPLWAATSSGTPPSATSPWLKMSSTTIIHQRSIRPPAAPTAPWRLTALRRSRRPATLLARTRVRRNKDWTSSQQLTLWTLLRVLASSGPGWTSSVVVVRDRRTLSQDTMVKKNLRFWECVIIFNFSNLKLSLFQVDPKTGWR